MHLYLRCLKAYFIGFAWIHLTRQANNAVPLCSVVNGTVEHAGKCLGLSKSRGIQSECPNLCQDVFRTELVDKGYQLTQSVVSTNLSQWILNRVGLAEGLDSDNVTRIFRKLKDLPDSHNIFHAFIGYKWIGNDVHYLNGAAIEPDHFVDLTEKQFRLQRCLRYVNGPGWMWSHCGTNASAVCSCLQQTDAQTWNNSVVHTKQETTDGTSIMYALTSTQPGFTEAQDMCLSLNCTMFTLQAVEEMSVAKKLLDTLPSDLVNVHKRLYIGYTGNKGSFKTYDSSQIPQSVYQYLFELFGSCLQVSKNFIDAAKCNDNKYCVCMAENIDLIPPEVQYNGSVNPATVVTSTTAFSESSSMPNSGESFTTEESPATAQTTVHGDFDQTYCTCPCSGNTQQSSSLPSSATKSQTENQHLKVEKKKLSRFKREKSCAEDDRESSKYMGVTAALVMSSVITVLVLNDCITFCNSCVLRKGPRR